MRSAKQSIPARFGRSLSCLTTSAHGPWSKRVRRCATDYSRRSGLVSPGCRSDLTDSRFRGEIALDNRSPSHHHTPKFCLFSVPAPPYGGSRQSPVGFFLGLARPPAPALLSPAVSDRPCEGV